MSNKKRKIRHAREAILGDGTPFAVSEAYKTLRINLIRSAELQKASGVPSNAVVVSSAMPGEGKSTTAANLALSFAQTGSRVLLIDANLRKSMLHEYFALRNDVGLSECLENLELIAESIHHGVRPGLDVLTAGAEACEPGDLLSSANMKKLIDIACRVYDRVIIDTPPINVVSDALAFAGHTAGILMVSRSNYCGSADLRRALGSLRLARVRALGIVLTDMRSGAVSAKRPAGGYGAYRVYDNYGYGYSSSRTENKVGAPTVKGDRR